MQNNSSQNSQQLIITIENKNNSNQLQDNRSQPEDDQIDSSACYRNNEENTPRLFAQGIANILIDTFKEPLKKLANHEVEDEIRVVGAVLGDMLGALKELDDTIKGLCEAEASNIIKILHELTQEVLKFFGPLDLKWQIIPIICKKVCDIRVIYIHKLFPESQRKEISSIFLTEDDNRYIEQYFIKLLKKDFDWSKNDQKVTKHINNMFHIFDNIACSISKEELKTLQDQIEELLKESEDLSIKFKELLEKCITFCKEVLIPKKAEPGKDLKQTESSSRDVEKYNEQKKFNPFISKLPDKFEKEAGTSDKEPNYKRLKNNQDKLQGRNLFQAAGQKISNHHDNDSAILGKEFESVLENISKDLDKELGGQYDCFFNKDSYFHNIDTILNILIGSYIDDKSEAKIKLDTIQDRIINMLGEKDPDGLKGFLGKYGPFFCEMIGAIKNEYGIENEIESEIESESEVDESFEWYVLDSDCFGSGKDYEADY